jgi:hypothetical protein
LLGRQTVACQRAVDPAAIAFATAGKEGIGRAGRGVAQHQHALQGQHQLLYQPSGAGLAFFLGRPASA